MTVHSGVWRPEDRAAAKYAYLPVDVPPGARGLTVTLGYDRTAGVLDLGLFDPAGAFRGWSGGARASFTVAPGWATPGYIPGDLPPGGWRVALGLHRVPPAGLPFTVRAETGDPGPAPAPDHAPAPARPPGRDLPADAGLSWLAGDLHAHTDHSDGVLTVNRLAALAAVQGLDFLAVTDHNTVSHHAHLRSDGVVLVPGQEVTTDLGHANAYGDIGWIDFRDPPDAWVSTVAERGGLLSVNHPLGADCAWRYPLATRPPLAELWHSGWWDRRWGAPLAWLLAWDPTVIPVGGSDFHAPGRGAVLGHPTTWVAAPDRSVAGVLDGLAAGRVAVSTDPRGPVLLRLGDELLAVDAEGAILTDFTGRRRLVRDGRSSFPAPDGVCWLEDAETRVLAVCR